MKELTYKTTTQHNATTQLWIFIALLEIHQNQLGTQIPHWNTTKKIDVYTYKRGTELPREIHKDQLGTEIPHVLKYLIKNSLTKNWLIKRLYSTSPPRLTPAWLRFWKKKKMNHVHHNASGHVGHSNGTFGGVDRLAARAWPLHDFDFDIALVDLKLCGLAVGHHCYTHCTCVHSPRALCMCVYVYIWVYVNVYMYTYVCRYIYIHT